jgi:protease IV
MPRTSSFDFAIPQGQQRLNKKWTVMSFETETVLDRRRLRHKLTLWRSLAILAAVAAVGALVATNRSSLGKGLGIAEPAQIARVAIEGMITEDREQLKMLKRIAEAKHVKGLVVFVNSPGGTTTGGEALFESLRKIAETKPVVAQFGTVAASAGYIVGLGADHIVARGNTITGSVGVIMQWPEVSELLGKLGVKMNEIKSGPLKASPSPFQPIDEPSRQVTQQMIMDSQKWFLSLVKDRRGVVTPTIGGLEQGRVYSGREAQTLKLVDEIGGEAEALRWLETKRNVTPGLKLVDWKPRRPNSWAMIAGSDQDVSLTRWLISAFVSDLSTAVKQEAGLGQTSLDGLMSVWHPAKN